MRLAIKTAVQFGDIAWQARTLLWLMVVGGVLEVLKLVARHAA